MTGNACFVVFVSQICGVCELVRVVFRLSIEDTPVKGRR